MRRLRLALALGLVLTGLCTVACQPPTAQRPAAPPVPDRVALAGDSLVVQASLFADASPADRGWYVKDMVGVGWQAEHAQAGVTRMAVDPALAPDVFIMAMGQNDSSGGLSQEDQNQLTSLAMTPHASTCIVVVKPWYQGSGPHAAEVAQMRSWVDRFKAGFGHLRKIVVVDWRNVVIRYPGILDPDGVHFREDGPAGDLYLNLMEEGVNVC